VDHRTLLLDSRYQPLRIISWMRALVMGFDNKVFVVETYDAVVRSPSVELPIPAVVALKSFHGHRPFRIRYSKRNVFIRDEHTCQYCLKQFSQAALTLDHVIPSSRGGKSIWENVVACCEPCNHRKGDRTPAEAGMVLRASPSRPHPAAHAVLLHRESPPEWASYLQALV